MYNIFPINFNSGIVGAFRSWIDKYQVAFAQVPLKTELPGNTNCGERFSTVGLLIKVAGFVKRGKQYFEYKKELIYTGQ